MNHPKEEKTLIIIKPDAIHRGLLGEIVGRFERKGLKIIGMKMVTIEGALLDAHYGHLKDKPFFTDLRNYMQSAPVIAIVLSGINAIAATRLIVGSTKASEADAGTIRGDLGMSVQSNLVHASDSVENGELEVGRFFEPYELFSYRRNDFNIVYSDIKE
jgi:nucleoside-diphosphate kinase